MEGANTAHRNVISAHTSSGCELGEDVVRMAAGSPQTKECDVGTQNVGCGYVPPASDTSSYGDTFNAVGGGIYAMQWDDYYIKVWHFDRRDAPADIAAKAPQPEGWGKPQAVYGGKSCDVKSHFRDMSIVLNINFCGDYGNALWHQDGCSALAPTCTDWVAKNPNAFSNVYWDVNYIDAYNLDNGTDAKPRPGAASSPAYSRVGPNISTVVFGSASTPAPSQYGTAGRLSAGVHNHTLAAAPTNSSLSLAWTMPKTTGSTPVDIYGAVATLKLPPPSKATHANPANMNDFSYLGCFGSNSGFSSFDKVADRPDMNLNQCTTLCKGMKYAGVYATSCYCSSEMDPDTRVSAHTCDTACPGNENEYCGGETKTEGKFGSAGIGAKANVTLPETARNASNPSAFLSSATNSSYVPSATSPVYPQAKNNNGGVNSTSVNSTSNAESKDAMRSSTLISRHAHAARSLMFKSIRPGMKDRRDAADFLLTVYAAVAKEAPPRQPPGMGTQTPNAKHATNTVVTTIQYQTVYSNRPSDVVNEQFVTTIVDAHRGGTETPSKPVTVPMMTKVVACSSCGPQGENQVTVTVPHMPSISNMPSFLNQTSVRTATAPPSTKATPTASQARVKGGASGVKVTSLLITTMLAMVALL